jgi:hypothetical protein
VALGAFPFVLAGFGWMTPWTTWHDPPKTPELNPLVAHDSTVQPFADPPSPVFLFVFDEWAADQDPEFREHFYRELLPRFRDQGKTLVVVSHDDRYFDCADRCLKMEFGQFIPFNPPGAPTQ